MLFLKNDDKVSEVFFTLADEIKMMGKDKSRIMKAN